jgi:hypothetical protein
MRNVMMALLLLLALAVPASAQTEEKCPCTITTADVVTLAFDHDSLNTTGYYFYVDGMQIGTVPTSMIVSGGVQIPIAAGSIPAGSYRLELSAFNAAGESGKALLELTVVEATLPPTVPNAPTNPRILKQ